MRAPLAGDRGAATASDHTPWSLWTVPASGGEPRLLFDHPEIGATRPDWSWSTGQITFTGIHEREAQLWVIDGDGNNLTHVPVGDPPARRILYPSWYPDGASIAVTNYLTHQVVRVNLGSGIAIPITDPNLVWAGMCSVCPDPRRGDAVAFAAQRPGDAYQLGANTIWVQYADGAPFQLDGFQGRMPAWSPAGDRIAFASTRSRPAPTFTLHPRELPLRTYAIFIESLPFVRPMPSNGDSRDPPVLATPLDYEAAHAKWSPDGTRLTCMARALDESEIGIAIIEL